MKIFSSDKTELSNNGLLRKIPDLFFIFLLMYISHKLLNDYTLGLAIGLMTAAWQYTAIFSIINGGLYQRKEVKALRRIIAVLASITGGAVLIFYDRLMHQPSSIVLIFLAALVMFRNIFSVKLQANNKSPQKILTVIHLGSAILFFAVCVLFVRKVAAEALLCYFPIAVFEYIRDIKHPQGKIKSDQSISGISSYRLFWQTSLYTFMSFYLSIFTFACYILSINAREDIYIGFLLGVLLIALVCFASYKLIRKIPARQSLTMFIGGMILGWLSLYLLFKVTNTTQTVLCSIIFGIGISFIYVAMYRQNEAFKQVSCIIDQDISTDILMQATDITQSLSFIISALIITLAMILRAIFVSDAHQSTTFSAFTLLLPFILSFASVIMALKQPLDASALNKLDSVRYGNENDEIKSYLNNILIKKYRKRYGVRIIAFFIKPFIYHKVYGTENVADNSLPAVFVCNHGEIYGPVTAVTHLPYYFRPWVHSEMLDFSLAQKRIYNGTILPMKIPSFIKKPLSRLCAALSTWALNSFDPVPVYLKNIRQVYKTMQDSVTVLAQGDSLLIFPENPLTEQDGRYVNDGISTLYTGFAQIGVEYYKKYNKSVVFYPIFASRSKRTFRIGKGIAFDCNNNRHDEKLRIASELEAAMKEMSRL